jgi:hypothetical protein
MTLATLAQSALTAIMAAHTEFVRAVSVTLPDGRVLETTALQTNKAVGGWAADGQPLEEETCNLHLLPVDGFSQLELRGLVVVVTNSDSTETRYRIAAVGGSAKWMFTCVGEVRT